MMELFTTENLIALLTLTAMEIVLGIDNLVFITILCGRVPESDRARVRNLGLILAVVMRVLMLLSISWIMQLTTVWFEYPWPFEKTAEGEFVTKPFTGKSLILLLGGLFLVFKAVKEIHHKMEHAPDDKRLSAAPGSPEVGPGVAKKVAAKAIIMQIILIDLVFSIDSVITAVGMVKSVPVMITAVVISMIVMIAFAGSLGRFVDRHPAIKMLALAFLVLIGVMLMIEGIGEKVPKGYIYFAMAFALGVEALNIRSGSRKSHEASKA